MTLTKTSVESVLRGILNYASRPLSEFNKYEALDMFETLQETAHDTKHQQENFYRLALQTVRGKLDLPKEQFRSLLLRLLENKDHEKVFDIVCKVEKHYRRNNSEKPAATPYERGQVRNPREKRRCFYCQKPGHFKADCYQRKKDVQERQERKEGRNPMQN